MSGSDFPPRHELVLLKRDISYFRYCNIQSTFGSTCFCFWRLRPWIIKIQTKLTSWGWVLLEKPPVVQLLKNFSTFYVTRKFITVFTRALHWSLSRTRSVQSIRPQTIYLRSILILSTHLPHGLPSGLFPSGFSTNILRVTCHTHLILLDLIIPIMFGEE
jgi:hypothetical protein